MHMCTLVCACRCTPFLVSSTLEIFFYNCPFDLYADSTRSSNFVLECNLAKRGWTTGTAVSLQSIQSKIVLLCRHIILSAIDFVKLNGPSCAFVKLRRLVKCLNTWHKLHQHSMKCDRIMWPTSITKLIEIDNVVLHNHILYQKHSS
jgi:hypothetical protein